jgi:AP2-associated kinase
VLNRRVVEFDGDIPLEKLMELQKKVKSKEGQIEGKQSSFITSKETLLIKEGRNTQNKPSYQQQQQQQQSFSKKPPSQQ